jgi:hypothetical protein
MMSSGNPATRSKGPDEEWAKEAEALAAAIRALKPQPASGVQLRADIDPASLDDVGDIVASMAQRCLSGGVSVESCREVVRQLRELAALAESLDDVFAGGCLSCANTVEASLAMPAVAPL